MGDEEAAIAPSAGATANFAAGSQKLGADGALVAVVEGHEPVSVSRQALRHLAATQACHQLSTAGAREPVLTMLLPVLSLTVMRVQGLECALQASRRQRELLEMKPQAGAAPSPHSSLDLRNCWLASCSPDASRRKCLLNCQHLVHCSETMLQTPP
mmetsp:Transcript_33387/g.71533  ORF Transcript_33387/g.71533 Transcript_33387/m.71533 type:complete len:156 (+) Transcript_33387:933-1400(+)